MVYDCQLTKRPEGDIKVDVTMTLTAPDYGMGPAISHDPQSKILTIDGVVKRISNWSWTRRGTKA